jgi:general secretion pathway protein L
MPQRILALDINDAELKAAVVETTFRDYKVAGLYRESLAAVGIDERLRHFVEQHGEGVDTILSSLPGDRVTWRTMYLPFRDRKRLNQTVPFELESSVPFDLDETIIDFQVLNRDREGTTVLAALVPKSVLTRHL